ncbi:hypothetical protein ACFP3U_06475 [Kitasatospora misakiensis]|uniref:Ig-like domain-containing protein n=1 Tax=Kitasatospora misakiensis TaxID=67330 RepID=A0ABW0WYK3_9ACTN
MTLPPPEHGSRADRTFRLTPSAPTRPSAEEPDCATVLDPTAWNTPIADTPPPPPAPPPTPPTPQQHEVRRFGPGVPPAVAAKWHGTPPPPPRRRRPLPWLVPTAAAVVLLALLPARCRAEPPLALTGIAVTAEPTDGPPCDGTAVITATVTTDGHPGTIHYRWLRNDGTASDELVQPVRTGEFRADLVLSWSFAGHGTMHATTTVEILAPRTLSASTSFDYTCRR